MENAESLAERPPTCLLCENDNVSDLVQCKFCNQVWYCDKKEETHDNVENEGAIKNGNGVDENNLSNLHPGNQSASTSNNQNNAFRYHGYPHRSLGLNYCQPFKGMRKLFYLTFIVTSLCMIRIVKYTYQSIYII